MLFLPCHAVGGADYEDDVVITGFGSEIITSCPG